MRIAKTSLLLDALSDLGLKTALDRTDRPPGSTRHAGHEEDTVLLRQKGIEGFARLAGDVFDDVTTKNVFYLFLLEATFDDQTARSVYRPSCTHFSEHELDDVLRLSVHSFTDIGNISKDRFLVSFPHDLWGSNSVTFGAGREEGGV